jgi:autotransporter-associated beta strand protein
MKIVRQSRKAMAVVCATLFGAGTLAVAQQLRVLGIDVSAWQGNISDANWATLKRSTNAQVSGVYGDGRGFVLIRSSRGGITGYYDQNDSSNASGRNTLSQRYDDPYYIQNITHATSAGLLAGTYHFARPDIIASTENAGGVANTGADEGDHMIQMAGPWMRPGYLPPVLDLESGQSQRTSAELTAFCVEFSDRIYARLGIRPMIYINGNYANYMQSSIVSAFPNLWSARWPNQTDPNSIPVQTGNPKDSYTPIYGPWADPPNPTHPWKVWQYASTARVNAINNGGSSVDVDVAQGGLEFIKDCLVPAMWMTNSDGQWTSLLNWNSGQTPVAPVQGTGQVARVGAMTLPIPRLPDTNDTVILDRPGAALVVTLASGTQKIRKLYVRETLNLIGGSLNINYVPSWDSTPIAAQFSAPVTLSGSASLSVHTLQVDATRMFTLNGGTLTFSTLNLMPDSTTPAKLVLGGDVNFNSLTNGTAIIANGNGSGGSGWLDLGGATRSFNVANGVDLLIDVPVANGGLDKSGLGTMRLDLNNSFSGGTTLSAGKLLVNNSSGSGTGSGSVTVNGGILGGTGTIAGTVTVNGGGTIAPATPASIGALTFNRAPIFGGTNLLKINRNGGSPLADRIVASSGILNYGGTLVISNAGTALTGGETFTVFVAPAYTGAFAATNLPALNSGLNWHLGDLAANGTIKVNRSPAVAPAVFTNTPMAWLKIPIAGLTANATDPDGDALALVYINLTTLKGITLLTDSTFLYYSNNLNVADQFSYTISDGHGGSATGTVAIAPLTSGQFVSQPNVNGNSVTLHFAGNAGSVYFLERSTNLSAWLTISTDVLPASGVLDYTDDFHDLNQPPSAAFYRVRWSP